MTEKEKKQALLNGDKFADECWPDDTYIYFDNNLLRLVKVSPDMPTGFYDDGEQLDNHMVLYSPKKKRREIIAEKNGVILHISENSVEVEFDNKISLFLPISLFSEFGNLKVNEAVIYRIVRDITGLRKQEVEKYIQKEAEKTNSDLIDEAKKL